MRYADDCNVYVRSKAAGERVLDSLEKFLERRLRLKVNRAKKRICYEITYRNLEDVTGAHLHKGDRGEIGREILTLFEGDEASPVSGCVRDVRKRIVKRLKRKPEAHYVDIDTEAYPDGAIRGQLLRN